jgi:D-sedoheptulose 7-phosphate isomerase
LDVEFLTQYLDTLRTVQQEMAGRSQAVVKAAAAATASLQAGNKLLLCGNGGSAADCQHVAAELVSSLSHDFERPPIRAIALTTDTSFLTAYSNDFGFDGVFERQVRALGTSGDVLVCISTSGASSNVLRAAAAARELGVVTIGLSGEGGQLESNVDYPIVVPSRDTQHIQETLLPIEHVFCYLIERGLYPTSQ